MIEPLKRGPSDGGVRMDGNTLKRRESEFVQQIDRLKIKRG